MTPTRSRAAWSRTGPVVLATVLVAALVFATTTQTWLTVELPEQAVPTADLTVAGSDAATPVTALAVVALAGALAAAIAGPIARAVTALIIAAAGVGITVAALDVAARPQAAADGSVAEATGVLGGDAQAAATVLPAVAAVAGVLLAACAVVIVLAGRHWNRAKRFDSATPAAGGPSKEDPGAAAVRAGRAASAEAPGDGAADVDEIDSWDQLSRGKDPTA